MKNFFSMATNIVAKNNMVVKQLFIFLTVSIFCFGEINAQGDNLGNHKATQNLNMNLKEIDDVKFVDIKAGSGHGIRFWSNKSYSISMGNNATYKYGPVSAYSIKNNMTNTPERGWTWGVYNKVPIAALNTEGTFQLQKDLIVVGSASIGNVSTPAGYKLYVEDGILTERVKIASVGTITWADFVFNKDYQLKSIEEVASFIEHYKHLPNIPSAKEVNEKGLDLVEMDAALLRQVEEIWLHLIELKKENEQLRKLVSKK